MKIDGALVAADLTQTGAAARQLERWGLDGLLSFEGAHDPFLPLAVAAEHTSRVELTTAVAIAFARNPMGCAYLANDLQLLSRGRFRLGLGSQIRPHVERRFGQPWSRPNARMREFVRAIRAIWRAWDTGERLDFRGEFYTHTLMTPFFSPGPNPHGRPPVALAGFGPAMIGVAGEVADAWIVHPLNSPAYVEAVALPALERGLARAGRTRRDVEVDCQTITMIGATDAEIARARSKAKAQIAFYGSTPAYKVMLDHHGWGALQPELNRLSKQGAWTEMIGLVSDEMLDTIGVSGTPAAAGRALRARNAWADRTSLVLYNETDPEAVADLVRAFKEG
ncbi:MAG TPA: TIGR03617 family F420-dependent LLM class oxidoreductase [Candidatus Limnocylindria bacterium]|nr:TIGR03617 family F420-dependent LLM class oxidoreductase [Candidatus Limnocylindria bacterium]